MGHEKKRLSPDEYLATLPEPLSLIGENHVTRKEVFARIRAEVKGAQACHALPPGPSGATTIRSVSKSRNGRGKSCRTAQAFYMDELADKRRIEDAGGTWKSQNSWRPDVMPERASVFQRRVSTRTGSRTP